MEFIPERIPNTPAYQRAHGECREQRVFAVVVFGAVVAVVVVFGAVVAVVVVFGAVVAVVVFGAVVAVVVVVFAVEILTIKVTHSACTFIHPLD